MSEVLPTPAGDLVVAAFQVLSEDEQEEALKRCHEIVLQHQEADSSETAKMIRSLRRAAEVLGRPPGIADYKRIRLELAEQGEELEPFSRITRHFRGSWHIAREALDLSQTTTARRIEERFRKRQLGKVWRYTNETLGQTLARAVEEIGHVPQVAEFDWWRQRQIELATAQGEDLHLPSATPYRRRWGTWERALLHFGFTPDQVAERLERS